MFGTYKQYPGYLLTPGTTLQWTAVSSAGHSFPYPHVLEVLLYDNHILTRNFWMFCTPVSKYPGYGCSMFCTLSEPLWGLYACHDSQNFWKFCTTSVPIPGTSGSSEIYSYPYPELLWILQDCGTTPAVQVGLCYNTRGALYAFRFNPMDVLCIMTYYLTCHTRKLTTEQQL